ncbi:glycerophosphodiester phosphodiesterase family protein [Filibacter tadaridae]|uniref:Glycerophosphoryl diester phosphodiesterase n=1 Tax=Filibacter tadaridae TaxID=2483811 RepID=A0A3P5XW65_9BACL|nr:glycerophosphodiester phosphodiesterase family protein [Filibacter tadaridae]VDC32385.1 Glycerophosphoryl diester phosphodiesterase [Filibacter tadaridae]
MSKLPVYAHRGASAAYFENTMQAFIKAYEQGADGIEIDVQVTEDGISYVIHDPDLNRVAGLRMNIAEMTGVEMSTVRIGKKYSRLFKGHSIPLLNEVVLFCEEYGMALNVELKETVSDRPESVVDILSSISRLKNVHISSFDYHLLEKVKECNPEMETALLVRKKSTDWEHLEQYSCADGFHLHKKLLVEPFQSKLIESGKIVRVYAVTGKEAITFNPPPFIDGWITDYPNRFEDREKDQDS